MTSRAPRRSALLLACSWLAACGLAEPPAAERTGVAEGAVINGQPDAGHPMIVAYLRNGSLCSATIVAVKGSVGYALTAAHCVGADLGQIVVGADVNKPIKTYPVTDRLAHPGYAKSTLYDVAMVKFSGADGSTATMAALSPGEDTLKAGSTVEVVGFGKTQDGGSQSGLKYKKTMVVKQVTDLRIVYDQKSGGICSGDSGGPSVFTTNGAERVAGVHSYVSSNNGSCLVEGTDIRVSPFLGTFVNPYIEGKPTAALTCDQCFEAHTWQGLCTDTVIDCYQSQECGPYQACVAKCKTASCQLDCRTKYAKGHALYQAILECGCDAGCPTECGAEPFCNPPACGLTGKLEACQDCFEASCCDEAKACNESGTCLDCVNSLIPGPNCQDDPTTAAYQACLATNCAAPCKLAPPDPTTSGTASSGSAGGGGDVPPTGTGGVDAASGAGGADGDGGMTTEVAMCAARPGRARAGLGAVVAGLLGVGLARRRTPARRLANAKGAEKASRRA